MSRDDPFAASIITSSAETVSGLFCLHVALKCVFLPANWNLIALLFEKISTAAYCGDNDITQNLTLKTSRWWQSIFWCQRLHFCCLLCFSFTSFRGWKSPRDWSECKFARVIVIFICSQADEIAKVQPKSEEATCLRERVQRSRRTNNNSCLVTSQMNRIRGPLSHSSQMCSLQMYV